MKMRLHSLKITSPEDHASSNVFGFVVREKAPDIGSIFAVMMKESRLVHE